MDATTRPIRSTLIYGLFAGLAYIPLCSTLSLLAFWPLGFQLSLWVLLAGYAALLSRWASRPLKAMGLPLLLLLGSVFLIQSVPAFLLAALGTLGWIRSGIYFRKTPPAKRLVVELGLGLTAGLLISGTVPGVNPVWALGVWLFFLIQALYFVLFEYRGHRRNKIEVDPFEKAKMAAENILSGGPF